MFGGMGARPPIKLCGVTREADAEHALALGVDYIGLNLFERSPRSVSPDRAKELMRFIPEGKRVLVDVNPGTDQLEQMLDLGFDVFQLHCPFDLDWATLASWAGQVGGPDRLWLAPKVPPEEPFPQACLEFVNTVLFDSYSNDPLVFGGTGRIGDWARFEEWRTLYQHKRWVLAGGLSPDNILAALASTSADVYDINSGVEDAPGVKNKEKLTLLFSRIADGMSSSSSS